MFLPNFFNILKESEFQLICRYLIPSEPIPDLLCTSNDWFLDEMQYWAGISQKKISYIFKA